MSITKDLAPNYWNGWYTMWIGNLIAFAPACVMYWPAYFSSTAAHWYGITWKWAKKAGDTVGLITIVLLIVEALTTGIEQTATKSIWITIVLYMVTNVVAAGIAMRNYKWATMYYMYPMWEEMAEMDENDGDFAELDDTATELLVKFFTV